MQTDYSYLKKTRLLSPLKGSGLLFFLCLFFLLPSTGNTQVIINEVFPNGTFELKNNGNTVVDVSDYWICTFPVYTQLSSLSIECGSLNLQPDAEVVLSGFTGYTIEEGELGLYTTNSFGSSTALITYVDWGTAVDQRASVGVAAGIWTEGDLAASFGATESLVRSGAGNSAADWSINSSPAACATSSMDCIAMGGTLVGGPFEFCVDGEADNIPAGAITLSGNVGATSQWVVTDDAGMILGLPPTFTAPNFDDAGEGVCLVYNVSYEGELMGLAADSNIGDLVGCFSLSNSIAVSRTATGGACPMDCTAMGGTLVGGPFEFCVDGEADNIPAGAITLSGNVGTTSQWVVTDDAGKILGLPPSFAAPNFDGAGVGVCLVYNISYEGELMGLAADNNIGDLVGCFSLSNSIAVTRTATGGACTGEEGACDVAGGTLTSAGAFRFCVDGEADNIPEGAITLSGNVGATSQWVVTDSDGNILGLPPSFTAPNFDDAGVGICFIYNLSYQGDLMGLSAGANINNLAGCFSWSNPIAVNRSTACLNTCEVVGGIIVGGPFDFCVDGAADFIPAGSILQRGNSGPISQWVVTDSDGNILGLPPTFSAPNFDDAGEGVCLIYYLTYEEGVTGLAAGENIADLTGCFKFSNSIAVNRTSDGDVCDPTCNVVGGTLAGGPFNFCVDGLADNIPAGAITLSGNSGGISQWVVTDSEGKILGLPPTFTAPNFDDAGTGVCFVYHISHTEDVVGLFPGESIEDVSGCFNLSNGIAVNRTTNGAACMNGIAGAAQFFVSSNTQQKVGVFNISESGQVMDFTFDNVAGDADGIHYDTDADVLYQLNRMNGAVNAYSNVNASLRVGRNPSLSASSSADSKNGREIAVSGGRLVVAQDASDANDQQNRFYVYDASPTAINLTKTYDIDLNLWGIHAAGETLYAIEDNSNRLAIFRNFFSPPSGVISPTSLVEIEGLVRTHGITYVAAEDLMLLTDVGAASSATDGAYVVVRNFMAASADGVVSLSEQTRIEGPESALGNPVDIAWDAANRMIFIAERANGGGRVLGFPMTMASGDLRPSYNQEFAGASAIHFPGEDTSAGEMLESLGQVFVSSNNRQMVGVYNILEDFFVAANSFSNAARDADGIYYNASEDILYQVNRMNGSVNSYGNVNANLQQDMRPQYMMSSSANFSNGRELAESNGRLVVAQDANDGNGQQNKLVVYAANAGAITFQKSHDVDINLWGIHADGETLYAIVDNSDELAVFDNFFSQAAGSLVPSRIITVEGIIRTHGLTYLADQDMMLLTDVGAASSATDGAFVVVTNFSAASADGTISSDEQTRVEGDATFLGNPVDIAYDRATEMIFVAERANGGGRLLAFALSTATGNVAPAYNGLFMGASAVYFSSGNGGMGTFNKSAAYRMNYTGIVGGVPTEVAVKPTMFNTLKAYPNPTADYLTIEIPTIESSLLETAQLSIFDGFGRQLQVLNMANELQTINISGLSDGIYYIVLTSNEVSKTIKFLKQNKR